MKWDVGGHIIHMLFGEFPTVFPFIAGKAGRKGYDTIRYEMWYNSLNDALVRTDNKGEDRFSATTETSMLLSLPQISSVLYLASL